MEKLIDCLSHGLINKFDLEDERLYDMVIVVSDRCVIDKQLQNQVKAIEKTKGTVEVIKKNSKQLTESLKSGTNIIVTTLHKFHYILEEPQDMPNRKYAVIIDDVHSSQTGSLAKKMKQPLGGKDTGTIDNNLDNPIQMNLIIMKKILKILSKKNY